MKRVYNFGAGPAQIPTEVLMRAHAEFFNWNDTGMNIMEVGHRTEDFLEFARNSENDLRELLSIPDNYKVLFLSGGATSQFAMVPINLLAQKKSADYLVTGIWSEKAAIEAARFCQVNIAATSKGSGFNTIPDQADWQLDPQAAYLYYAANETIAGVEFPFIPESGDVPLVADMSSNLLSRPLEISRFACIFACAQKNMGQAGLTIVIVRDEFLGKPVPGMPSMFDYQKHAEQNSMLNTPPTYAWYISGLCFAWLKAQGGLAVMQQRNLEKAQLLYSFIDQSDFYLNAVPKIYRSLMNIPFRIKNAALESEFLVQAKQRGLVNLKGHKLVGGMRASIYNAMPRAGVEALIVYMRDFMQRYG